MFEFLGAAGAGAAEGLDDLLLQQLRRQQMEQQAREAEAQLAQRSREHADVMSLREREFKADEDARTEAREIRGLTKRKEDNQSGVRRMIGDFLIQRGAPKAADRSTLQGMAMQEDVDLPASVNEPSPEEQAAAAENARTQQREDYVWQKQTDLRFRPPAPPRAPERDPIADHRAKKEIDAEFAAGSGNARAESRAAMVQKALSTIDLLKKMPGKGGAVGAGFQKAIPFIDGPLPGTNARNYTQHISALKSQLTLPELEKLRGLGAMSDREFRTLSEGATALDASMSESAFDAEIQRLEQGLREMQMGGMQRSTPDAAPADLVYDPKTRKLIRRGGQ